MKITKSTTSTEVQEYVSNKFPGIKIEFFKHSHDEEEGSPKSDMITEPFVLSEVCKEFSEAEISINETHTVGEVESWFENEIGAHIQVFRQAGRGWIETTKTDDYTLAQQMERAHA
jgi:hypothetical protein